MDVYPRVMYFCILQDENLDNIKWPDRYSDRNRWKARQIEINWVKDGPEKLVLDDSDREDSSATKTSERWVWTAKAF